LSRIARQIYNSESHIMYPPLILGRSRRYAPVSCE
jgi:hypothetical protein